MILSFILAALLATSIAPADYRQALNLYDSGLYERARTVFEQGGEDPLCEGYVVLCALKMRSVDYPELYSGYMRKYPSSSLTGLIRYENAMRSFDQERYAEASDELALVPENCLPKASVPEFVFKKGYCHFSQGRHPEALAEFERLDEILQSDYSAPARYLSGVMHYSHKEFEPAASWFRKSVKDPRFKELSNFYIVDCEFNMKNYDFVIEEGEKIYDSVPKERQEHLARAISESYLIRGNKQKAREYLDNTSRESMTRSDYFHAGFVLYSVDDFAGAVENFTLMADRTDSLGQIANYKLGNAYIRLRDKVSAMNAFKDAAQVDFDQKMTEDAFFNYAKLAFDLNKDTEGFSRYISRYSTKVKGEQIYSYMALAALYDKDYAAAVQAYDNIDELDEGMKLNYAKANYLQAVQLVKGGSNKDAIPYLRACSYYIPKNDRFNQLSRYWLAESYYRTGNYQEAAKVFTDLYNADAIQDVAEGRLLSYNVAYSYLNNGDFSSAARWFDTYARSGRGDYLKDALTRRADCDFLNNDYKAAIESYGRLKAAYPDETNLYAIYRQGLSYGLSKDRKDRAKKIDVLKAVEKADPSLPYYRETLYELGRAQADAKKNEAALASFKLLRDNAGNESWGAKALIGMGMVCRNMNRYDDALTHYKAVVELMPGSEYAQDALPAIESIYQAKKQPQKYLEYVEQNSLNRDKSPEAMERMYFNTAEQLFLAGNYDEAEPAISKYLEKFPEGQGVNQLKFYLAESFKARGDKEKACEVYGEVAATRTEDSFNELALLNHARLSYELQRYDKACESYAALKQTARIDANKEAGALGLMRSAFRAKSYQTAIENSELVLKASGSGFAILREASYVRAKSYLATSQRDLAMEEFRKLSSEPSTDEGAEANYILIQDAFDRGKIDVVESMVYDFSGKAGDQSYWLARSFIVLADSFIERDMDSQAKATLESIRDGYTPEPGVVDDIAENVRVRLNRIEGLSK
ncbi:MAG: tetratricopeptide repeat protein [Bacteroidales bacterium]|nr:tetratricopeptide repeat protein [Candidatus Cryptobacteroides equifaecalis]